MLKIFKKIKYKIEEKILKCIQEEKMLEDTLKDTTEFSRIVNRPNEGEIVKIDNIKIFNSFTKPNPKKLDRRRKYYLKHRYFRSAIVLSKNNYLVDGYTTYLLAKEMKFDYITIVRKK